MGYERERERIAALNEGDRFRIGNGKAVWECFMHPTYGRTARVVGNPGKTRALQATLWPPLIKPL